MLEDHFAATLPLRKQFLYSNMQSLELCLFHLLTAADHRDDTGSEEIYKNNIFVRLAPTRRTMS